MAETEKPLLIKGVCLHHDAGVLGAAVPREVWRTRLHLLWLLAAGALLGAKGWV